VCFYVILLITLINLFSFTVASSRFAFTNSTATASTIEQSTWHDHINDSSFFAEQSRYNPKMWSLLHTKPTRIITHVELVCAVYFTLEFILRFSVCPYRMKMLISWRTVCDLLYLLPLWVYVFLLITINDPRFAQIVVCLLFKIFQMLRVIRIFTLVNHYRALWVLFLSLRASMRELFLLFVLVLFAMTIYSCLMYSVDLFIPDSDFENLPVGLWWAVITLTTVGYGDMKPHSTCGYVVGALCALTGIVLIGMSVPIISDNFHAYYCFHSADEDIVDDDVNE